MNRSKEGNTGSSNMKPDVKTRNHHVSMACKTCKKQKARCSGPPLPCRNCKWLGVECKFDPSQDKRRREVRLSLTEHTKRLQQILNGLLQCLKMGDSHHVEALIQNVRRDGSAEGICATINTALQSISSGGHFRNQSSVESSESTLQSSSSTTADNSTSYDTTTSHPTLADTLTPIDEAEPIHHGQHHNTLDITSTESDYYQQSNSCNPQQNTPPCHSCTVGSTSPVWYYVQNLEVQIASLNEQISVLRAQLRYLTTE